MSNAYVLFDRDSNDSDDSGDEKDPDKKKFEGALSGQSGKLNTLFVCNMKIAGIHITFQVRV